MALVELVHVPYSARSKEARKSRNPPFPHRGAAALTAHSKHTRMHIRELLFALEDERFSHH